MKTTALPIDAVLPDLARVLTDHQAAVLTAPPGAGKTTRVPLALLEESWLSSKRLILLEPRRLAARAAATRMARALGEPLGRTVGFRIRHESKIGPMTRLEVVTEGILTRILQHDPSLAEYACVVFDEFHERSLHADLGLALTRETQRLFRPDLRILVMSATLDCTGVSSLLGHAPVVTCEGRSFPVEVRYLDRARTEPLDQVAADAVRRVLRQEHGSVLVFLPGMGEIRRVERRLHECKLGADTIIAPLHGDLPQEQQEAAIAPAPSGCRKVVLATSIAETSLTIEDVRVVIDGGWLRVPRYAPRTGLTRLDTIRVTKDSADQRCGRAGRTAPGLCLRLWTSVEHHGLLPRRPPEILDADLTGLQLELAVWGVKEPEELSWMDAPPSGAIAEARRLLVQLGAVDYDGVATDHGRRMSELGLHPRLAHMILTAMGWHRGSEACAVAALLSERDFVRGPVKGRGADLRTRLDLLTGTRSHAEDHRADGYAVARVRQAAEHWRRQLGLLRADRTQKAASDSRDGGSWVGSMLALAYPDRIAQRVFAAKGEPTRYRLANGRGACFPERDALESEEYLVVADLDGDREWARIALSAPIARSQLDLCAGTLVHDVDLIEWDERTLSVCTRRQRRLGALVLEDRGLPEPDPEAVRAALMDGIRRSGLSCLRLTGDAEQWRARVMLQRRVEGVDAGWPDASDRALLDHLEQWLGPSLTGLSRLEQLSRVSAATELRRLLTWQQQNELDRSMPTHYVAPTGTRLRLDYTAGDLPVLSVRLQEMFGCRTTPSVANGRLPVLVHLLSPAGRPVQVTQDLAGFWKSSYFAVRKELRGRYPKHLWPDDPLSTPPTRHAKRTAGREHR